MALRLRTVVSNFLLWAESALKPSTVSAYRHQLRKFLSQTKNKQTSDLCQADVTKWARTWHEFQAVQRCFAWATDEAKLIEANPFADLDLPTRNERKRIMLPRELAKLLRSSTAPGRRLLLAMRESYARPQEIRAATWLDLASEDPEMSIEDSLAAGTALIVLREYKDRARRKEANKPRVLLVSPRLGRMILRQMAVRASDEDHIFLNSKGQPWTNQAVRCLLRRLRRRLGIKPDRHGETIVAYSIRHSQATLAASKGIRDRLLADILGHVETRTTSRYCHLQVGHLREAIERIASDRISGREKRKRKLLGPDLEGENGQKGPI